MTPSSNMARPMTADTHGNDPRRLPHDPEAEAAVLSALLMDANAVSAVRKIPAPDAFSQAGHRRLYETIIELDAAGSAADVLTVIRRLQQREQLDTVGGHAGVAALIDVVIGAFGIASAEVAA